jgi:hypothetical protein
MNVDGVINSFQAHKVWPDSEIGSDDYKGYAVMWAEDMVSRLRGLASVGEGIELVWVSSWGADCRGFASLVGLGALGVKARILGPVSGVYTYPDVYWKAESIWDDLHSSSKSSDWYSGRWAWFDPAAVELMDVLDYADFVGAGSGGYVPVIRVENGITPEILDELKVRMEREIVSREVY